MNEDKIKVAYYPYSIIPDNLLKQLAIYFDEINICLPISFDILDEYRFFYENKLINIQRIPFCTHLKESHKELQYPASTAKFSPNFEQKIRHDLQENVKKLNEEIQKLKQEIKQNPSQMTMTKDEIQKYKNILSGKSQYSSKKEPEEALEKSKNIPFTTDVALEVFEKAIKVLAIISLDELMQRLQEYKRTMYIEFFLAFDRVLPIDVFLEERVIGHFLVFLESYRSGQVPFTDNPKAQEIFLNIFRSNIEEENNLMTINEVLKRDTKTVYLAMEIFKNYLLPLPGLETKSHQDILELKERIKNDIEAFKIEMRKLVWDIKNNPWDNDFKDEIICAIDQKINPTIKELERRKNKDSAMGKLLKLGGPSASLILAMQAIPNISTELTLEIFGLGIGAPILGEWLEERAKKQSEYNGLNLFVKLKNELN